MLVIDCVVNEMRKCKNIGPTKFPWKRVTLRRTKDLLIDPITGYETARSLALHGCSVIMACRNTAEGNKMANQIREERPEADLKVMGVDLASLRSVKEFAAEYKRNGWLVVD